jgi:tRNA threonylcarbamoyladenosine biosynthesis protein TsaB
MALILNIETSTTVCSVALALNGEELMTKEMKSEKFSHSENLNLFIEDVFEQSNYQLSQLDAVAVSKGPGSYTGLRIGFSCAKGLCFGLNVPLLSINSLKALASLSAQKENKLLIPMFDARRMEVYDMILDEELNVLSDVEAKVIDETSFADVLEKQKVIFLGPGAEKCKEIINSTNAVFDLETEVSAKGMVKLSESKFNEGDFEDVAYFEPFYLKDFIAGKPKKLL